jgi:hypothetical protein
MEAVLATFLAPFLPYLMKKVEAGADKAIDTLGAAAWERAQVLWRRLRPKVEEKEGAREAAAAVAESPDDEAARGALQFQLRGLLAGDPDLATEIERMLREAQEAGVMADNGAVIIHGDVRADRGGVAAGRDVVAGEGGIRTGGWRESDEE